MRDLMKLSRSSLERPFFDQMDRIFNEFFGKDFFKDFEDTKKSFPKINVFKKDNHIYFEVFVGDIPKDNIKIKIDDENLTIEGRYENIEDKEKREYVYREISRRAFSRVIALPREELNLENVEASQKEGILFIKIPYKSIESIKEKVITIN